MTVTLYRCPMPTDVLCPCGKVARRLRREGYDVEEVRVDWRKRDRDEIDDLTGQRHVPVVVLEREVICDSRRVLQHLRWRREASAAAVPAASASGPT